MPRIHTITTDTVLSDNDMLLGTDGAVGANNATKNFSFGVFKNYITSNVTFTGDTIISGGNLTLDNNKFLMSKMANGTAASLIGISSNNQIKLSNSNLPIYTGTGLVSLGGNLELPNGGIIANGTLTASGYNSANWNAAYVYSQVGHLPLTGGTITGNMINRGEQSFGIDGDGELFKIYTNTSGKLITFNPAANGKLNLTDNTMATFGTSDDLQIYHNGTANYIDSNGGQMFLRASVSDGKMYFMGDDGNGGYTEYFYIDGSTAVYDSNMGQAVSVETRFPSDSKATFGITGSMQTSLWNSNAGNFFMSETGGGNMYFQTDGTEIVFQKRGAGATHNNPLTDAETMAKFIIDGAVELYHNNNKKLETTASGIQTTGTINIHGAYSLPITDGTNGQVLKTNGSGVVAFADDLGSIPFIDGGTDFDHGLIIGHSTHVGTLDAAERNVGVGNTVLEDLTTGDDNTVLGHAAGMGLTSGSDNTLIGAAAGYNIETATDVIAIGARAIGGSNGNSTGQQVVAIGNDTVKMGYQSGSNNIAGTTAIGHSAGEKNQSFGSTFIGWNAGSTVTGYDESGSYHDEELHSNGASRCVIIGGNAGTSAATVANEIVIGFGAKGKGANTVVIGNNATTSWLPQDDNGVDLGSTTESFKDAYIQGALKIGDTSGSTYFQLPSTIGTSGQVLKVPASGNALVWAADMPQFIQEGGDFTNSLIIGHVTTGTLDQALGNTGIGVGAMNAITQGDSNVAVGHDAAGALTTGDFNVAIGKQALFSATTNNQNVAVGKDALYAANYDSAATDGNQNTAIGFNCGSGVTTGTGNVFIGYDTGKSITTGNDNIVIGSESNINTVKSGTIVIGHGIVDNYVENNSTYIGHTYTTKANVVGLRKNLSYTSSASQQVLLSQSGGIHRMTNATPSVTTLPDSAGNAAVGMEIEFVIGTNPSGGVHKIVCHNTSSQEFVGSVNALDGTTLKGYSAQDSNNYSAISFNGTTTGVVGTRIKLTCITSSKWLISGTVITNGTPANPFTTT